MGREIRRVPPTWEHPKVWKVRATGFSSNIAYKEVFQPMHDRSYLEACSDWKASFAKWESGEGDQTRAEWPDDDNGPEFWDWHGMPPEKAHYFPEWPEQERTAFQVYENVSEGTPVSPVFTTSEELEAWFIAGGMSPHAAKEFITRGWTMTGLISPKRGIVFGMNDVAEELA